MMEQRLVDANDYKRILNGWIADLPNSGFDETTDTVGTTIFDCICQLDDMPTIEAEPVVYCKNCIRWQKDKTYDIGYCYVVCSHTNPKNFCCWGENSPFAKKDGD